MMESKHTADHPSPSGKTAASRPLLLLLLLWLLLLWSHSDGFLSEGIRTSREFKEVPLGAIGQLQIPLCGYSKGTLSEERMEDAVALVASNRFPAEARTSSMEMIPRERLDSFIKWRPFSPSVI